jgi:hypothetical protein
MSKRDTVKKATGEVASYQPNEWEQSQITEHRDAQRNRPPKMKISEDGAISSTHDDLMTGCALLARSMGTDDIDLANRLLTDMLNLTSRGQGMDGANSALGFVQALKPQDAIEATLAVQMYAIHSATMTMARRLDRAENLPQQDSAERSLNKLARTFTTQVEALKRHRTGGEQKMTVEHVTVNEGGQAIVGNVSKGEAK